MWALYIMNPNLDESGQYWSLGLLIFPCGERLSFFPEIVSVRC